ncbi:TPA: hypothetical protein ACN33E_004771 [Vibrio parahaemolyticus]|nr:hypothetical protein [Vibrio parahaemolyticus]
MSKLEKFYFYSSIFGLLMNVVSLLGLIFGHIEADPQKSIFLSSPAISLISFTLLLYSCLSIKFYALQFVKSRWATQKFLPAERIRYNASILYFYIVWSPLVTLWGIAMWYLWGLEFSDSSDSMTLYMMVMIVSVVFLPIALVEIIKTIDVYINPKDAR